MVVLQSKRRLYTARFTVQYGPRIYEDIATSSKDLTNVPGVTVEEPGKCPKTFITAVDGSVVEYWK